MRAIRICLLVFVLAACASVPPNVERTPSKAFAQPETTALGKFFAPYAARHADESGFAVVQTARSAFTARIGLADLAEHSVDLQYYIWESDRTGRVLASKLLAAADRGVRVRVLIDDNNLQGRDFAFAALDQHPNLEIRVFNPFAHRGMHILDFLTAYDRVTRRMHNKVMIADGAVAVLGGRNIGDDYFGVDAHANFRDLDIAAVGPVVAEAAASFDRYWNSEWAYPIYTLYRHPLDVGALQAVRAQLASDIAAEPYPYPLEADVAHLLDSADAIAQGDFVWARGHLVSDDPSALMSDGGAVKNALRERFASAQKELLIESAYFVLRDPAVQFATDLIERGVRIRVLTNSLASNDVAAAHAGYEKHRRELLQAGVELYELRPDAGQLRREWTVTGGHSIAALHTKAVVFDRETVFVGSFNLDPRSADLNTEVGLLIDSPELAAQVTEFLNTGVSPENAYHVTLNERGRLRWTTEEDGRPLVFRNEPDTRWWKRFVADVIKVLPIDQQI
jgi:cardiolipin synthase C